MALNTSKPGIVSEIDRALANALGLQALFLFQEPSGYIRDSVTKAGAALSSGGVAIDQPGLVLTFNGSQAQNLAFALPVPGTGTLPAAAQNFVIMARFKPTGAPAATPGQIFGICASAGTQGAFGVGTDTSNNVGQTWLSGSGAGIGAYTPGALNNWYTVYAALSGTNGAEQFAWINGVPATSNQGSSTSSGGAGTMNEIVFGAQHRSSGFLRQAKGNLEWAAILYNAQPIMTDQLAAELFAADFPYNLLLGTRRRPFWMSSGGGGTTFDQSLTTSLDGIASLSFLRGKGLSSSIALSPSLQRGMTKGISASVGASPSLSALKAFLWSLSTSVAASASLSRVPGKALFATISASASFAKSISHALSASIAGSPTVSAHKTSTTDQALTASVATLGTVTATDKPFSPPPIKLKGFPNVPEYLSNPAEQRRTISRRLNSAISGKINCTVDVTLNASATTTTLTDPRIGYYSVISPAMPMTSSGATALKNGIWIGTIVDGSAVINHASNAATDQTIRFSILG